MTKRNSAYFSINGKLIEAQGEELFLSLAEFLRHRRAHPGTKIVCAEGDCGACSILKADASTKEWVAFNSCITQVAQCDAGHFVTVEGLESGQTLHPVQKAMLNSHASQCGYCTPGFATTLCGLLEGRSAPELAQMDARKIKNALTGNLCRCTGYQPIVEAGISAARAMAAEPAHSLRARYLGNALLRKVEGLCHRPLHAEMTDSLGVKRSVFAPVSLSELRGLRARYPGSILLGAGTDLGVAVNKGKIDPLVLISLHRLKGLRKVRALGGRIEVGSGVTLTELRRELKSLMKSDPRYQLRELVEYIDIFASPQIKNVATLVGNLANASPIGDMPPVMLVLEAELEILSGSRKRRIALSRFYRGYRKTALRKGEVILSVKFDLPLRGELLSFRKVTQRRDLDISCVNAGFRARKNARGQVTRVRMAMGGVAATPLRLLRAEKAAVKQLRETGAQAQKEISPLSDLRGSEAYRRVLAEKMIRRFLGQLKGESHD